MSLKSRLFLKLFGFGFGAKPLLIQISIYCVALDVVLWWSFCVLSDFKERMMSNQIAHHSKRAINNCEFLETQNLVIVNVLANPVHRTELTVYRPQLNLHNQLNVKVNQNKLPESCHHYPNNNQKPKLIHRQAVQVQLKSCHQLPLSSK